MCYSAICVAILKVDKPGFSSLCFHPSALMGAIDVRVPLMKRNLDFVRTIDVFQSQDCLPFRFHTPRRSEDIVVTVSLVYFRTLNRRLMKSAIVESPIRKILTGDLKLHAMITSNAMTIAGTTKC